MDTDVDGRTAVETDVDGRNHEADLDNRGSTRWLSMPEYALEAWPLEAL